MEMVVKSEERGIKILCYCIKSRAFNVLKPYSE